MRSHQHEANLRSRVTPSFLRTPAERMPGYQTFQLHDVIPRNFQEVKYLQWNFLVAHKVGSMTFYFHYLFCIIVWFDEDSRAGANHKNNHNFLEELIQHFSHT